MAETIFETTPFTDPFAQGRPSWLPGTEEYRTPAEDWARFTSGMQPFWSTRAPMQDLGQRLEARYLLGAPQMAQQGYAPTFGQFLSGYRDEPQGLYGAGNVDELRRRAAEAATAATTAQGPYLASYNVGTPEWNRRAWMSSQFGPSAAQAQANQLAVANLLALQRPQAQGGGVFRGRMADAIRSAMGRLQQQRLNQGAPRESFLEWYLGQTAAEPSKD